MYTLINAAPSPYGRKVAVALLEKGLTFDTIYDLPWSDGTCTPTYSPLEQLPILVSPDGEKIYDSTYILDWLEVKHPRPALLPGDSEAKLEVKLRQMLAERLMEAAQSLVFELHRPDPSRSWVDRQTRKVRGALSELENIEERRRLDPTANLDLGDIALATTLLVLEYIVPAGLSPEVAAFRWRNTYRSITERVQAAERRSSFESTKPTKMTVDLPGVVS